MTKFTKHFEGEQVSNELSLFVSRRPAVSCLKCGLTITQGHMLLAEDEKKRGFCAACAEIKGLELLPPGDAAMTRRSKKYSSRTIVVQEWNNKRKRYERLGQFVEPSAIIQAKEECESDQTDREAKNAKAAIKRSIEDREYRRLFAIEIRKLFPSMPANREMAIAEHACEKYSGRVGRTASAKEFDEDMITRAVIAHIRHAETNYDNEFGKGKRKREIREDIRPEITLMIRRWKREKLS